MEQLNNVWLRIEPIVTNATFIAIMTAIVTAVIRGTINRKFKKVDLEGLFQKTIDQSFERFKGFTFEHDITPIVVAEVDEFKSQIRKEIEGEFTRLNDIIYKQTRVIGAIMAFYDNSAVPQEVKDNAHALLEDTFTALDTREVVKAEVIIEDAPKPKKEKKTIER